MVPYRNTFVVFVGINRTGTFIKLNHADSMGTDKKEYKSSDSFLHSAKTSSGMSLIVSATKAGSRITSSKYPRTGIKSGIKSIGERA